MSERSAGTRRNKLIEIPGVGDKTAAKIMEAARDLFEEVEIEVPEGIELPTAIQAPGAPRTRRRRKPKPSVPLKTSRNRHPSSPEASRREIQPNPKPLRMRTRRQKKMMAESNGPP